MHYKKIIKLSALHSKTCGAFFLIQKSPGIGDTGARESTWKALNYGVRLPLLICIFLNLILFIFSNNHKFVYFVNMFGNFFVFICSHIFNYNSSYCLKQNLRIYRGSYPYGYSPIPRLIETDRSQFFLRKMKNTYYVTTLDQTVCKFVTHSLVSSGRKGNNIPY